MRSGARLRRPWHCGVSGCAAGLSNKAVAAGERVTAQPVGKWRRRFVERGLDGLLDEPRPRAPRTIDDGRKCARIGRRRSMASCRSLIIVTSFCSFAAATRKSSVNSSSNLTC
jgi:hypothetical protein